MTNGEAIMRIKEHMRVHHMGVFPHIKIAEALKMAISALAADNNSACEWIPVTERLPKSDTTVLVYRPTMGIKYMQSYYHKNIGFCDGALDIYGNEVITHWMPLPTPPKDGE